jgi:hypothetical protein
MQRDERVGWARTDADGQGRFTLLVAAGDPGPWTIRADLREPKLAATLPDVLTGTKDLRLELEDADGGAGRCDGHVSRARTPHDSSENRCVSTVNPSASSAGTAVARFQKNSSSIASDDGRVVRVPRPDRRARGGTLEHEVTEHRAAARRDRGAHAREQRRLLVVAEVVHGVRAHHCFERLTRRLEELEQVRRNERYLRPLQLAPRERRHVRGHVDANERATRGQEQSEIAGAAPEVEHAIGRTGVRPVGHPPEARAVAGPDRVRLVAHDAVVRRRVRIVVEPLHMPAPHGRKCNAAGALRHACRTPSAASAHTARGYGRWSIR